MIVVNINLFNLKPSVYKLLQIFLLLVVSTSVSLGAEYYVDINNPNASDQNPGTESLPWRTLQKAAQATLSPGDTVFVKGGTYSVTSGGSWSKAAITPKNSGEPGKPITFKSLPEHAAIIDGGVMRGQSGYGDTQALIGSSTSYVVIDGFIVRNAFAKGILVMGPSKGVTIQNNIVSGISHTHPTDNTDGIRVEETGEAIIRNNLIFNVHNGTTTHNAAGIKLYSVSNSTIENNEAYDAGSGIFDKHAGRNNVIRNNYTHDVGSGIRYVAADGYIAGGNHIYGNVITRATDAIHLDAIDTLFDDTVYVYNNVMAEYSQIGLRIPRQSAHVVNAYNNIFYRTGSVGTGDIVTYDDPPNTILNSDYNIFVTSPQIQIGRYVTNRNVSLDQWNSITTYDGNSQVGSVSFVDPANDNFKLAPGSFGIGFGRVGGVPSGAIIDAGAYTTPNTIVGIIDDLTQPRSPVLESVEIN